MSKKFFTNESLSTFVDEIKAYTDEAIDKNVAIADLSQVDETAPDYVKGVIRQESLPEGYPYKAEATIEWDGNTEGRYSLMGTYYHVSDEILSNDVLKNSTFITNHGIIGRCDLNWDERESSGLINDDFAAVGDQAIIVVRKAGIALGDVICEKAGIYFLHQDLGVSPGLVYIAKLSTVTINTIAPEFLPESATAQSDWNQNDETASDYVKNRPFYTTDPVETVFVSEETVTISSDGGSAKMSASMYLEHENYIVYFNGTKYECTRTVSGSGANVYPNDDSASFYITGNLYDELYLHAQTAGTYTVSLATMISEDVKVPDKYLNNSNITNGEGAGAVKAIFAAEASGDSSFAEGFQSKASGMYSHAEGDYSYATGHASHAENGSDANGSYSHAEGYCTTAQTKSQHTQGEYNIIDTEGDATTRGTYAHIVGNGTSNTARSNAHTLDWSGNAWFAGDVYVGSTSGTNKDEGSVKLMKEVPVTTSDNGKFLRVVNGAWAATTVPNAEEVEF